MTSTIPSPPPEDDGSELHPLTLDGAREAITELREREQDYIETARALEVKLEAAEARELALKDYITRLETELANERAKG